MINFTLIWTHDTSKNANENENKEKEIDLIFVSILVVLLLFRHVILLKQLTSHQTEDIMFYLFISCFGLRHLQKV